MTRYSSSPAEHPTRRRGFTLVEMAVVLAIAGLMLGGLLVPLAAQMEQRSLNDTRAALTGVKEALLGYAMANGRFPCPAAAPGGGTTAVEAFAANPFGAAENGACAGFFDGYVPGVTLGLSGANRDGYVQDGWHHPLRYAVSDVTDGSTVGGVARRLLTSTDGIRDANAGFTDSADSACGTLTGMAYAGCKSLLFVCNAAPTATPGAAAADCGSATSLAISSRSTTLNPRGGVVLVIYSTGKNTASGGTGKDEAANPNPNSGNDDAVYVSHEPAAGSAANGEFDDVVEWLSTSNVFGPLVQAGRIP